MAYRPIIKIVNDPGTALKVGLTAATKQIRPETDHAANGRAIWRGGLSLGVHFHSGLYGFFFASVFFSCASAFASSCWCDATAPVMASTFTSSTPGFPATLMS